jgi:hypothetical protein
VPFIYSMGVCFSCSFPPPDRAGMGHDYELWPVCPGGKGSRTPTVVQAPEKTVFHDIGIDHQKAFPVPGPGAQPAPEPAQSSSNGTGGEPTESSRGKPRVRVLDAETAPEPEPAPEPVRGMQPVPVATEPDWTDLSQVDGPSWGP